MQPSGPLPSYPCPSLAMFVSCLEISSIVAIDAEFTSQKYLLSPIPSLRPFVSEMPSTAEIETRVRIPCSWGFPIQFVTGEDRPCSRRTLDCVPYSRVGPKEPCSPGVCVYILNHWGAFRADGVKSIGKREVLQMALFPLANATSSMA